MKSKHEIVHNECATTVVVYGNPKKPEPQTAAIEFPGGNVEVTRDSNGRYWAHIYVNQEERDGSEQVGKVEKSRIDYTYAGYEKASKQGLKTIPSVPFQENVQHIAVCVAV